MAGHWRLNKLIVLYDDNGISIDVPISIADPSTRSSDLKSPAGQPNYRRP